MHNFQLWIWSSLWSHINIICWFSMHEIESPFTAVECMMQKLLWSIVCEPDSRIEAQWTVDSIEVLICWQQSWQECWKCCGCPEVGVDRKSWLLCSHLATASPHLQRTQGRQKINYLLLTFTVFTQHLSGHLTTLNPSIVMGLALNVDLDCCSSSKGRLWAWMYTCECRPLAAAGCEIEAVVGS